MDRQLSLPCVESTVAELRAHEALSRLVGEASEFVATIGRLPAVARSTAAVVITGETGTGKELIARAVHYLGPRAPYPFVPINCGALPDTLLEDELFGHERGAFTDAKARRPGLLAQAERGTVLLDEVDSLTPRAQVALLRVLQGGTYRALGGDEERSFDVRFIAATNAALDSLVRAGHFRSDLYYRLCVLALHIPPLRERVADILLLARHFLAKYHEGSDPLQLADDAQRSLVTYSWPGNVRELENVMQRAIAMARGPVITAADLGLPSTAGAQVEAEPPSHSPLPPFSEAKRAVVDAFERSYLQQVLRAHRGNVSQAAQSAHKERRDFGRLLKKHRLDPRSF